MEKTKYIRLSFLFLFMAINLFGERLGELTSVLKPQMIRVHENHLYVVEGHKIFHFNLPDLRFLGQIGKEGEGPGEFRLDPSRTLITTIIGQELRAESRSKLAVFSLNGTFLREEHKPPTVLQSLPLGKNRLLHYIRYEQDGRAFFVLDLTDPEGNRIKELYQQKFFQFGSTIYTIADGLNFVIIDDRVWVEKSPEGFALECFDDQGNSVRNIVHKAPALKVEQKDKEAAKAHYLKIPFLHRLKKERGEAALKSYLGQLTFEFPNVFPPVRHIKWDGRSHLLVLTYDRNTEGELHYVLDKEGNLLGAVRLPQAQNVDFLVSMQGDKQYYDVFDDYYYFLRTETGEDDEEHWVLNRQKIKWSPSSS